MKFNINMVLQGADSIQAKIEKVVADEPSIISELIKVLGMSSVLAFRFNGDDNVSIINFSVGPLIEDDKEVESTQTKTQEEKPKLEQKSIPQVVSLGKDKRNFKGVKKDPAKK